MPGRKIFAGGTLDQPRQLQVLGEYYTDFALPWARLDSDLTCRAEPDNVLRAKLIERARTVYAPSGREVTSR